MKKILSAIALTAALSAPTFAQTERVNPVMNRANDVSSYTTNFSDEYQQIIRAQYEINFRGLAIEALNLNSEETTKFTPIFLSYMERKQALNEARENLVTEFKDEMSEDNSPESTENETADFIENYWESDIDEMELKKDYFDRLEDEIGTARALKFFDLENMYANRLQRITLLETLPMQPVLYVLEPISFSYKTEMDDYNNWNKIYIDGQVALDHEFTYNGLSKLLTAAEAMTTAEGISVANLSDRKAMIMNKAEKMKKDWRSLSHADLARDAFVETASVLKEIANDARFTTSNTWLNKLDDAAKSIKPNVKLTEQGPAVNNFFDTAQYIVNNLVDQANGMNVKK